MRLRCPPPSPEQAQDEGWGWESEDGNGHADADPTSGSAQPRARANATANNARPRRQLLQCCHAKCTSPATIAIPAGTVYEYTAPLVIDRSGQFPEVSGGEQWQGGVWAQDAVRASHTPFWQQGDPSDTPAWQRRIRCSRCTGCGSMVTGQCLHCGAGPEMSWTPTGNGYRWFCGGCAYEAMNEALTHPVPPVIQGHRHENCWLQEVIAAHPVPAVAALCESRPRIADVGAHQCLHCDPPAPATWQLDLSNAFNHRQPDPTPE